MSNDGKLAFVYMLTHPMQTSIGAMRTTVIGLSHEMKGLGLEAFTEAFSLGMALESSEAPLVWFPNFTKYNNPESPNVANAWGKSLLDIPQCGLRKRVYTETYNTLKAMGEAFVKGFNKGLGEGDTKDFIEDYALSEAVAEANYLQQYTSCYTCACEGDSAIHPVTGEVFYED